MAVITANLAKQIAINAIGKNKQQLIKEQSDRICEEVIRAANRGWQSIFLDFDLYSEVKEELLSNGYQVDQLSHKVGEDDIKVVTGTLISWI